MNLIFLPTSQLSHAPAPTPTPTFNERKRQRDGVVGGWGWELKKARQQKQAEKPELCGAVGIKQSWESQLGLIVSLGHRLILHLWA